LIIFSDCRVQNRSIIMKRYTYFLDKQCSKILYQYQEKKS